MHDNTEKTNPPTEEMDEFCDNCGHAKSKHRRDGCYFNGSKASCRCAFGGGR